VVTRLELRILRRIASVDPGGAQVRMERGPQARGVHRHRVRRRAARRARDPVPLAPELPAKSVDHESALAAYHALQQACTL
jgi:hypothetical protein